MNYAVDRVNHSEIYSDHGDEVVMFVGIAQTSGSPKIQIRVPARFYFFRNEVRNAGEGLLDRSEFPGGFKVLPFFGKGKMKLFDGSDASDCGVDPDIHAFPKIVHNITSDCAKMLRLKDTVRKTSL